MKKMLALIMISVAFGAQAYVAPAQAATPAKTEKKVEKKEAKPKAPPSATKPTPKKKIGEAK
jgi:hypothetical protein